MPAPQLHFSFALTIEHSAVPADLRRVCRMEPTYTRLGAIFHDLPYYGNMVVEAIRYGLGGAALDEPWSYRMHSVRPGGFLASYIRAARTTPGLTADEGRALVAGLASHCALDLTLHPLVNYCARRDAEAYGGHESMHHRLAEKYQALFLHLERRGSDPIGTPLFREWTRVVKAGARPTRRNVLRELQPPAPEAPLVAFMQSAYRGAYGGAPTGERWAGWVRSLRHFGHLVGGRMAARNSERVRHDAAHRERYYQNDVFEFGAFYACSERRMVELVTLCDDYFAAGDFSAAAEARFLVAARIDDLAEPVPQAIDRLPDLPRLLVRSTPGVTRPAHVATPSPAARAA